jgi:hypothetical protein
MFDYLIPEKQKTLINLSLHACLIIMNQSHSSWSQSCHIIKSCMLNEGCYAIKVK